MNNVLRAVVAVMVCALGGCATVNPMAFDKKASSVSVAGKSVVLLTIDLSRPDKSRFEPAIPAELQSRRVRLGRQGALEALRSRGGSALMGQQFAEGQGSAR